MCRYMEHYFTFEDYFKFGKPLAYRVEVFGRSRWKVCFAWSRLSRSYMRKYFMVGEPLADRVDLFGTYLFLGIESETSLEPEGSDDDR